MTDYRQAYTDTEALDWMLDIAAGIHFLHSLPLPVVHRVRDRFEMGF
jgi:hypothetical protein